ncbi:PP0621 family protein [Oxalobacteraceae bacterium A2-2]
MSRILVWLALVALVVFAIRSKLRGLQQRGEQMRREQQGGAGGAAAAEPLRQARQRDLANTETMLCCAHCGVYYPASENVPAAGRDYCSPAHAQLAG